MCSRTKYDIYETALSESCIRYNGFRRQNFVTWVTPLRYTVSSRELFNASQLFVDAKSLSPLNHIPLKGHGTVDCYTESKNILVIVIFKQFEPFNDNTKRLYVSDEERIFESSRFFQYLFLGCIVANVSDDSGNWTSRPCFRCS